MTDDRQAGAGAAAQWQVGPLTPDDLDEVVAIDAMAPGQRRPDYFERRLGAAFAEPERHVCLGLREGRALIGFALARLQDGEFGSGAPAATLDTIGVYRRYRGLGAGRRLLEAVEAALREKGVRELATEVDWSNHELLQFMDKSGFELAPRLVVVRAAAAPLDL